MKKNDVVFGIHAVNEAIESGKDIDKILVQKDNRNPSVAALLKAARERGVPVQFVPVEKINRITTKNHQGVLCFMAGIEYQDIENLLPMIFEKGEVPLFLILDRITDVRNFGAIVRTAECAGVHALVVPDKNAAQINADAVKTSSGAIHRVNICRVTSLISTIKFLKQSGLQIIACTEKTEDSLYVCDFTLPSAIIIGSEEDGIDTNLIAKSDASARIPLLGDIGSLNVSVAAGVVMYEAVRQRMI